MHCFWGDEFYIGVKGLFSLCFVLVIVPVLPHDLNDQSFKGIGLLEIDHQLILKAFNFI